MITLIQQTEFKLVFIIVVLFFTSISGYGNVFNVNTEFDLIDDNIGDGLCQTTAMNCSLRAAVQESNASPDPDKISLPAGTYVLSRVGIDEDLSLTGDLDLLTTMEIEGVGSDLTFIDGNQSDRVFELFIGSPNEAIKLSHLTIQNGQYSEFGEIGGSGLLVKGRDLELFDVNINNNTTFNGGATAVHIDNACVTGEQVRVNGNTGLASWQGTIYIEGENACLALAQFEIFNNESNFAAALFLNTSAQVHLQQGLIAHNKSSHSVIAINNDNQMTLDNVTVSSNESNGAILNDGFSTLLVRNSTITKNMGYQGVTPTVGGIHDVHGGTGMTFLTNSIVAGNGPGFLSDDIHRANSLNGGNILGDVSSYASAPSDLLNFDPMLGPLASQGGFTDAHLPHIKTVDLGNDEHCLLVDQFNQSRPQDGNNDGEAHCDAGAVELRVDDLIIKTGFE